MTKKDHWFPFFPRDFYADGPVQLMDADAESCYLRLLAYQWLEGSIPADLGELAKICSKVRPARFRALWPQLAGCFHQGGGEGRLRNRKLERVRAERLAYLEKKSRAGRKGNAARWKGAQSEGADPSQVGSQTVSHSDRTAIANGIAKASPPLPLPKESGSGAKEISVPEPDRPPSGGSAGPIGSATDAARRRRDILAAIAPTPCPDLVP